MQTTLIKRREAMRREALESCYGGRGALDWVRVLAREDTAGRALLYMDDDRVPPGATIGIHPHEDEEEYYYVLSGRGVMTLDGEPFDVRAGDVTAVFPGGRHGLENTGDEEMRVLVVCVRAPD